jgi:hypothetical protein
MDQYNGGGEGLPYSILAVDLGVTTGSAWYYHSVKHFSCTSISDPRQIFALIEIVDPKVIIVERFPETRKLPRDVEEVYNILAETAILISPSTWKPFMREKRKWFPQKMTQHEKDAVNILRYYMMINFGEDLP